MHLTQTHKSNNKVEKQALKEERKITCYYLNDGYFWAHKLPIVIRNAL